MGLAGPGTHAHADDFTGQTLLAGYVAWVSASLATNPGRTCEAQSPQQNPFPSLGHGVPGMGKGAHTMEPRGTILPTTLLEPPDHPTVLVAGVARRTQRHKHPGLPVRGTPWPRPQTPTQQRAKPTTPRQRRQARPGVLAVASPEHSGAACPQPRRPPPWAASPRPPARKGTTLSKPLGAVSSGRRGRAARTPKQSGLRAA